MKKLSYIFLILLLLVTCFSCKHTQTTGVIEDKNTDLAHTFVAENFHDIAVNPSYKYLGTQDFSDERIARIYHIWKDPYSDNCVIIYYIEMKEGSFPSDTQWINKRTSIYDNEMRVVYSFISGRLVTALENLNIVLPPCYLLAQEVYLNSDTNQAVLRMLLKKDERCSEHYQNALDELDRVAITNN